MEDPCPGVQGGSRNLHFSCKSDNEQQDLGKGSCLEEVKTLKVMTFTKLLAFFKVAWGLQKGAALHSRLQKDNFGCYQNQHKRASKKGLASHPGATSHQGFPLKSIPGWGKGHPIGIRDTSLVPRARWRIIVQQKDDAMHSFRKTWRFLAHRTSPCLFVVPGKQSA